MKGNDTSTHRRAMLERLRRIHGRVSLATVLLCTVFALTALTLAIPAVRTYLKPFGVPPAAAVPAAAAVTPPPVPGVQWLGFPEFTRAGATGHLTNVEFGIREDGVVIWRDKRGPAVDGKRFGDFPMPPDLPTFQAGDGSSTMPARRASRN